MAFDPPRNRVLVTDSGAMSLYAIDLETRHVRVLVANTPSRPLAVAVDPTDQSVFIACDYCIIRLDEEAGTHTVVAGSGVDKMAMTGRTPVYFSRSRSMVIDRTGALYVAEPTRVRNFVRTPAPHAPLRWLLDAVPGGWLRDLPTVTLDGSERRLIMGYATKTASAIDVIDLQTGTERGERDCGTANTAAGSLLRLRLCCAVPDVCVQIASCAL
jgi:hypothetical protein